MGRKMTRGKQQVLFSFLPGRTFDFEKIATIARVSKIRGIVRLDLNATLILNKIADDAKAWHPDFRPALRDEILRDTSRFVLLEPAAVSAEMFPRVLWCQNSLCGRIVDAEKSDSLPHKCPSCRIGQLIQLRFVRIHRCGALEPVVPPFCKDCKSSRFVSLDTRGGERFASFLWTCTKCTTRLSYFAGLCRNCEWPTSGDLPPKVRNWDVEVHRAGRTFYAQSTVLLNIPDRDLDALFRRADWPFFVAAKYLQFPEVENLALSDFGRSQTHGSGTTTSEASLSNADLDDLLKKQAAGEITAEQIVIEIQRHRSAAKSHEPGDLSFEQKVVQRTGVPATVWERAGYELFESILPGELSKSTSLATTNHEAQPLLRSLGLDNVMLESDYPIINATYGYTRVEYRPNDSRLNPFPPDPDHVGCFPVFIDQVQADALLLSLAPATVFQWLSENNAVKPEQRHDGVNLRSFFVRIFDGINLRETVREDQAPARLTFGLLHTLSHLCVRRAGLLSGLEHTSLSEYLLPRSLSFAIYCNHRFGETIGALTALFEQSATQWLDSVANSKKCVYDPVCKENRGSCHACTHLAETSCRFFNLNLNRAFLFGGVDERLGPISKGYLQFARERRS
jgi:hypothetical protein